MHTLNMRGGGQRSCGLCMLLLCCDVLTCDWTKEKRFEQLHYFSLMTPGGSVFCQKGGEGETTVILSLVKIDIQWSSLITYTCHPAVFGQFINYRSHLLGQQIRLFHAFCLFTVGQLFREHLQCSSVEDSKALFLSLPKKVRIQDPTIGNIVSVNKYLQHKWATVLGYLGY